MKVKLLFLLLLLQTFKGFGQQFDVLIRNGKILDGTGNPWYLGDVGIKDGQVIEIGELADRNALKTIDAKGQYVCPGFIDVHAHVEGSLENRPTADNFIHDGVTTVVTGNCGGSRIDLEQYFNDLRTLGISINMASLIGHNTIRRTIMGNEDRAPTAEELENMEKLVARAMEQGAVGMSTGLIYLPGTFAKSDEIISLAKVAHSYGGVNASHIRNEDERVFAAIREAADIGAASGISVEISHFKITGKPNWGRTGEMIDLVNEYRKRGVDVTVDQYPYTASSTSLDVLLPDWALEGTDEEIVARIQDPATRKKIRTEMLQMLKKSGFKNYSYAFVAFCPWDSTINGMNLHDINLKMGRKGKATLETETILDLAVKRRRVQMVYHKMNETDVETLMQLPYALIASDAGIPAMDVGSPHPRAYGTNARVLGRYVREHKTLTWEDAIRKMTSLPAQKFHLEHRGMLLPGYAADVVIFDPATVSDQATFDHPHAYSTGINYVVVNGVVVIDNGEHTGTRPGQILTGTGMKKQ
ncbi:MAG: D-aminoacylase [Lewinellaceae bacterium]|nr:D-aminoacylase [Lewinellaceae bacterium]